MYAIENRKLATCATKLRNSLDRASESCATGFADWLAGQQFVKRLTQIVRRNVRSVLRIVDASVIDELAAGIEHVGFRRPGGAQSIGDLVAIVLQNCKGQMFFRSVGLNLGSRLNIV